MCVRAFSSFVYTSGEMRPSTVAGVDLNGAADVTL